MGDSKIQHGTSEFFCGIQWDKVENGNIVILYHLDTSCAVVKNDRFSSFSHIFPKRTHQKLLNAYGHPLYQIEGCNLNHSLP